VEDEIDGEDHVPDDVCHLERICYDESTTNEISDESEEINDRELKRESPVHRLDLPLVHGAEHHLTALREIFRMNCPMNTLCPPTDDDTKEVCSCVSNGDVMWVVVLMLSDVDDIRQEIEEDPIVADKEKFKITK
jgi:hypothetical protein